MSRTDFEKVVAARLAIREWVNKQDHESCWFYPEIFTQLCVILGVPANLRKSVKINRKCFEEGCTKYQDELYGGTKV